MPVEVVEVHRASLPLAASFRTAAGAQGDREVLFVRVLTPAGDGWGECAALPEPTYTAEYVGGARDVIVRFLAPALLAAGEVGAANVGPVLAGVAGHPMAKAALEAAVLDAELRAAGRSLAAWLGGERDRVPAGVAVGIARSVPELVDDVARQVDAGYLRVKLKIEPGWDVEPVAAVRLRFPDLALSVDGNGSYRRTDIAHLCLLDRFGLVMLEQPLPAGDLLGHAELARAAETPVCLDEPVSSALAAADAIELGACEILNVKPGRMGGLFEARRAHDLCLTQGVPAWCGGMLEAGLGRAALVALASLPGFTLPGDVSPPSRWYGVDVVQPPLVLEDGHVPVPTGPGTGVEVDVEALAAHTLSVDRVARAD